MAEQYSNQVAAAWARHNLAREIEIKLRGNSWLARIVVALAMFFLGVIFFGIPAILFFNASAKFVANGWSGEVSKLLWLGLFFLVGFGGLVLFLFFYVGTSRRKLVRLLSADGLTTRGGKKYYWQNLQYLDYVPVQHHLNRNNLLFQAVSDFIFDGVARVKIEMVFTDGTVTIAPLIENQRDVLDLLETIPVPRKLEGKF